MAHLVLQNVTKRFGDEEALKDVSFECRDGEFLCLLGPSGAGKTTTISVISGLLSPDGGRILIDGEEITHQLPQQRDVATAFESYALYPHLTVSDNIAFPLRAPIRSARLTKAEVEEQVRQLAQMLAIDELLDRYPRQLSGGQRQRVALGRALIRRPRIYLLDEPIAHLDAKLRHRMRGELRKIQLDYGISTIYATPDQLEALSMADRIVVLNQGRVEQIGEPDAVYRRPANTFVARFVGDPPMNILDGRLTADSVQVASAGSFVLQLPEADCARIASQLESAEVKVGFRPGDVRILAEGDPSALARAETREVDTLGQASVVGLQLGAVALKARLPTGEAPARGQVVGIAVDRAKLHYFDPGSGARIALEP